MGNVEGNVRRKNVRAAPGKTEREKFPWEKDKFYS